MPLSEEGPSTQEKPPEVLRSGLPCPTSAFQTGLVVMDLPGPENHVRWKLEGASHREALPRGLGMPLSRHGHLK